jgi:hypothetical protein
MMVMVAKFMLQNVILGRCKSFRIFYFITYMAARLTRILCYHLEVNG